MSKPSLGADPTLRLARHRPTPCLAVVDLAHPLAGEAGFPMTQSCQEGDEEMSTAEQQGIQSYEVWETIAPSWERRQAFGEEERLVYRVSGPRPARLSRESRTGRRERTWQSQ